MGSRSDNNGGSAPWDLEDSAHADTLPWMHPPTYLSSSHSQRSEGETRSSGSSSRSISSVAQYASGDTPPTSPCVYLGPDAAKVNQSGPAAPTNHVFDASRRLENSLRRLGMSYFAPSPAFKYPKPAKPRPEGFIAEKLSPIGPPSQPSLVTPPHSRNVSNESHSDLPQYNKDELINASEPLATMPNKTAGEAARPRAFSRFSEYAEAARNNSNNNNNTDIRAGGVFGKYALPRPATCHEDNTQAASQMRHLLSFNNNAPGDSIWYNRDAGPRQPAQWELPISSVAEHAEFEAPQLLPPPSSVARTPRFRPMQAIANSRASFPQAAAAAPTSFPPAAPATAPLDSKFSMRYHGMHNEANASAEHISDEENCAVWLTNLPPDVTYGELLRLIHNTGRVWCTYINEPDYVTHKTAAAKVVYFTAKSAQRLLTVSWTSGLHLRGHAVRVAHNRIKTAPHASQSGGGGGGGSGGGSSGSGVDVSRVLIITGSSSFANPASLTEYFSRLFIFQTDEVKELITAGGRTVVEFRFGSYRCQAQMGKMALEKDRPEGFLKVEFGQDPCEVGENFASFGIAAERIQGKGI